MDEVPTTDALQTQRELDCDDTPTEQEDAACNRVFVVLQFRRCADWQLPSCKTRRVHLAPYYRLDCEIVTNSQPGDEYTQVDTFAHVLKLEGWYVWKADCPDEAVHLRHE